MVGHGSSHPESQAAVPVSECSRKPSLFIYKPMKYICFILPPFALLYIFTYIFTFPFENRRCNVYWSGVGCGAFRDIRWTSSVD